MKYCLAIDIGASSGRHIKDRKEDGGCMAGVLEKCAVSL